MDFSKIDAVGPQTAQTILLHRQSQIPRHRPRHCSPFEQRLVFLQLRASSEHRPLCNNSIILA